jgi:NAD+ synthase (glutamine-hydrolysing)
MVRYGAPPEKILFLAVQAFNKKYPPETIKKWLRTFYRRFFSQQFKRSCLPDGPKVGTISLSPEETGECPAYASAEGLAEAAGRLTGSPLCFQQNA